MCALLLSYQDKLLMIGDSITDCGRKHPIGEGLFDGLGKGYVALVDAMLQAAAPELAIRVINMGNSGNTVRDLKHRFTTDVLDLQPDWLSIMIGINDVWRQYDQPLITESHVYLAEYELTLRTLVANVRPQLKGLVLMTPYYLEANTDDPMRATMDLYGHAVKRIANDYDAVFIDTQKAFDDVLQHVYSATIAWDRVHPSLSGHMILARAFLQAVQFSL